MISARKLHDFSLSMTHNSRSPAREFGLDSVSVNIEVGHTDTDKVGNPSKRVPTFLTRRGKALALVAIGANPLDFFPTASPSSHHPHRPLGTGQFVVSFSPNLFLLPITFFPENVFRPATDRPLNYVTKFLSRSKVTVPVTGEPREFVRSVELSEFKLCLLMCPSPPCEQLPA